MAEVYWIRHVSHTDVFSEGYVGVTSKTANERFSEHKAIARQPKNANKFTVHKALNKYPEDEIVVETLIICDIDYAYEMEYKLRPSRAIGWNQCVGGFAGVNKNKVGVFKHSPEFVKMIKEVNSNPTPETRKRKSEGQKRRYSKKDAVGWSDSFEYIKKLRNSWDTDTSPWRNPRVSMESLHKIYNRADEIFNFIVERDFKVTNEIVCNFCGCESVQSGSVQRVVGMIFSGWVPEEDPNWLRDFRDGFFLENNYLRSNGETAARRKRTEERSLAKFLEWVATQSETQERI